jgi:hypothetical protein
VTDLAVGGMAERGSHGIALLLVTEEVKRV